MVSIGFSSWTIGNSSPENPPTGSINVEDVKYVDNFATIKESSIFTYYNTGFVDDKSSFITDTGHINVTYEIDIKTCKTYFSSCNNLVLDLVLGYASSVSTTLNLFSDSTKSDSGYHTLTSTLSCNDYDTDNITISSPTITDYQYSRSFTFTDILSTYSNDTLSFSVDYAFYATPGTYFKEYIYSALKGNNISFKMYAQIQGN
jgi:hypothetical protein